MIVYLIQTVLSMLFLAALVLWPAGTLAYAGGWAFLGLFAVGSFAMVLWLSKYSPRLRAVRPDQFHRHVVDLSREHVRGTGHQDTSRTEGHRHRSLCHRAPSDVYERAGYVDYAARVRYRLIPHVW